MKKKVILRGIFGFPLGLAIGYLITIVISLVFAEGYYAPCVPAMAAAMGNEINAVMLQAFLCGLLGMGSAASSVIWEIEHWSIVKQTGIYFLILAGLMMPIAYLTHWMEHSVVGFFSYFGFFTLIFAGIWLTQVMIGKHNVRKMNAGLYKAKHENRQD